MKCKKFRQLILPYLNDQLLETDKEQFELHYFNCDKCFQELNLINSLQKESVYQKEAIKNRQPKKISFFISSPVSIAASLILVICSLLLILNLKPQKNLIEFEPPFYIPAEDRNQKSENEIEKAFQLYNEKNYSQALKIFQNYPHYSQQVIFYRAICLLMVGEYKQAINDFDEILRAMNPSYYDEALFYKSIALIRMNRKKEAQELLTELTQIFSPLETKARAILEKIN